MRQLLGLAAGAAMAVFGSGAAAATLVPSDATLTNIETQNGFADLFAGLFTSDSDDFSIVFNSFDLGDPAAAVLDYDGFGAVVDGASAASIMAKIAEFLFDVGGETYLFTVDITGSGEDLTDPMDFAAAVDATLTIDRVDAVVIPLPASLSFALAGVGGLVLVGRRRKAARV